MRVACVIPCRAGSRRVPGKNTKPLNGKPLLSHVLEAATASGCFGGRRGGEVTAPRRYRSPDGVDVDIVGCGIHVVSDDSLAIELAETAHGAGTIEIPSSMAGSDSPVIPVLAHAAEAVAAKSAGLDAVCYLRATSPFVRPSSVQRAVLELLASRARCSGVHDSPDTPFDSVVGVMRVTGAHPSRFKRIDSDSGELLDAFPEFPEGRVARRSETLHAFQRNSAVTACWLDTLLGGSLWGNRVKALEMGEIESVDINTPLEFEFAEFLSSRGLTSSDKTLSK